MLYIIDNIFNKEVFKIPYKNLQHYKYIVHKYLDGIWLMSSKKRTARNTMYKLLSDRLNISLEDTHVKLFTRQQCKDAIKILKPMYIQLYGHDLQQDIQKHKKIKQKNNEEEDNDMRKKKTIRVTRHKEFEASHLLPNYDGDCANLHGHTYKIEVTAEGPQTDPFGMVIDFKQLDKAIKAVMPDHRYLHFKGNEISEDIVKVLDKYGLKYMTFSWATTAENMSGYFMDLIQEYLDNELGCKNIKIVEVKLWETTNSFATAER